MNYNTVVGTYAESAKKKIEDWIAKKEYHEQQAKDYLEQRGSAKKAKKHKRRVKELEAKITLTEQALERMSKGLC